jgi:hypothetical protein
MVNVNDAFYYKWYLICGPRKEEVTERASDKLREQVLPYSEVSASDLEKVIMDCDQCIYSIDCDQ